MALVRHRLVGICPQQQSQTLGSDLSVEQNGRSEARRSQISTMGESWSSNERTWKVQLGPSPLHFGGLVSVQEQEQPLNEVSVSETQRPTFRPARKVAPQWGGEPTHSSSPPFLRSVGQFRR